MVIDTSVFVEFLRAKDKTGTVLYSIPESTQLFISSVTLYELLLGATSLKKKEDIKLLTDDLTVLPFDELAAEKAAEIYHQLRLKNNMIEFRDIFIAATGATNKLPVKTLNKKDFTRIDDLKLV